MAEEVQVAEPAPAPAAEPVKPTVGEILQKATPAERRAFELHRTMPEPKPSEPDKGATARESEPREPLERKETPEERSARDKDYQKRRSQLKTQLSASEQRARDLERKLAEATRKPADSAPARESAEPELVMPNFEDFETTADYNKAVAKAVAEHTKKTTAFELDRREHLKRQEDSTREANQQFVERDGTWREKETAFLDVNKDYLAAKKNVSEFFKTLPEKHPFLELEEALIELENPAVLYHLGKNSDEFQRLLDLPVKRAIAELGRLEMSLDKPPAPTVKTISSAPRPAKTVAGRSTAVEDPLEAAKKAGDWKTFNRIADERKRAALGK